MVPFTYYNPAKICFGRNAVSNLNGLLSDLKVKSLLLVYSGDFIKDLGIYDAVRNTCNDLGIDFHENGEVVPNPRVSLAKKLIEQGKKDGVDVVIAAGGGSSIDTAKTVALGIPYDGDVWDYFRKQIRPEKVLPVGVITTLPASGSETSNAAIMSTETEKIGFENDAIIPKFAIMDPTYTLSLPEFQTAAGVADILSHLLERYFSDVEHTDLTDYMIEGAVKALLINGKRVMKDPGNFDARAEIQWTASVAHNNLLDTGRTADWGSHRIEHELSARYNITHGEGMAVVMPAWIRYIADIKPKKPAQLASRVFGADPYDYTEKELALILADKLEKYFRDILKLRTRLGELDIDSDHYADMAAQATHNGRDPVGHYLPLDEKRFTDILKLAE